jgi:hypothetical protein
MKVKIFKQDEYAKLEKEINDWLAKNPCFIEVKFITHTVSRYQTECICIFYEETGIKDKGDYMK